MESSGITQSSIDAAEAEFITLYSCVNYGEKYILASDFFSKLASVLYYKNGVVFTEKDESIYTTLHLFDIDILALLDDFCFQQEETHVIEAKDKIRNTFETKFETKGVNVFWIKYIREAINPRCKNTNFNELAKNKINTAILNTVKENTDYVKSYLNYLDGKGIEDAVLKRLEDIFECYKRRKTLKKSGCKLPCTACKYATRSIVILMKQLFGYDEHEEIKALMMLRYASHHKLFESRPEMLSQLAASSEQLADIMLSCACTKSSNLKDKILPATIKSLSDLISEPKADKRDTILNNYQKDNSSNISRLDLTILWYWSACRYYDIASMHQEAVHCIWRITSVIENYLSVLYHIQVKNRTKCTGDSVNNSIEYDELLKLLNILFTEASRIVSRQYDNYNTVEIHELKWILHFEHIDDIDLTQLTQFPNLQSIFISIINCNLTIYRLNKNNPDFSIAREKGKKEKKDDYIIRMYSWITRNRHNRTFKSDVELNYLKVKLNYLIFDNILKVDDIRQHFLDPNSGHHMQKTHDLFYKNLTQLFNYEELTNIEKTLFAINHDVQSRLDLLEFLIDDTISCLSNIINTLPPHNQFSTFSNSFVADIYSKLWEWSKYYELMYNAYYYFRHYLSENITAMNSMRKYTEDGSIVASLAKKMNEYGIVCKDDFGFKYTKLNANMRHDVDDATMHHIYINYSSEMAIKYYRAARGINSEGQEYKNLINTMYILDDDLRNDTCQSNLADERYLINSGVINDRRLAMQNIYKYSRTNKLESFENYNDSSTSDLYARFYERYSDSMYTNTEY